MNSAIIGIDQLNAPSMYSIQPHVAKWPSTNEIQQKLSAYPLHAILLMTMRSGLVSTYDDYFSYQTRDALLEAERNPIGVWLIELDGGGIGLFMTCAVIGTMTVFLAIPGLCVFRNHGECSLAWVFRYFNYGCSVT